MQSNSAEVRPFSIEVPETELTEVRRRLNTTRWPERVTQLLIEFFAPALPTENR